MAARLVAVVLVALVDVSSVVVVLVRVLSLPRLLGVLPGLVLPAVTLVGSRVAIGPATGLVARSASVVLEAATGAFAGPSFLAVGVGRSPRAARAVAVGALGPAIGALPAAIVLSFALLAAIALTSLVTPALGLALPVLGAIRSRLGPSRPLPTFGHSGLAVLSFPSALRRAFTLLASVSPLLPGESALLFRWVVSALASLAFGLAPSFLVAAPFGFVSSFLLAGTLRPPLALPSP